MEDAPVPTHPGRRGLRRGGLILPRVELKSSESLPPGGRIIVHEMLFNDDRTGPFPVAAFNVDMLVGMPGQQYSGREINGMLAEAGFVDIEAKPTFGYWSIVTGKRS